MIELLRRVFASAPEPVDGAPLSADLAFLCASDRADDLISEDERAAFKRLARAGLVRWQAGSWGDSDYWIVTDAGRARIAADRA